MFFLELSCFFYDPTDGNLISGSSGFSTTSLNIWKFMVHVLLKPGLENFEHYFTIMWDECNCEVVWAFFGIAFLRDWNENWPFPALWPLLSFPNLLAYWVQHFHSIIFQGLKQLNWNSITSTSFVLSQAIFWLICALCIFFSLLLYICVFKNFMLLSYIDMNQPWIYNVWQKPLQYCKVISLQLIKINEKKKPNKQTKKPCMLCKIAVVCFSVQFESLWLLSRVFRIFTIYV